MLKELLLLVALLAFVTDARPHLNEEVRTNSEIMRVMHLHLTRLQLENEADSAGMMNDDAVEMDEDGEEKLLEGKDCNGLVPSCACNHLHVIPILCQGMINNYLRVKNVNRMKATKVGNDESK